VTRLTIASFVLFSAFGLAQSGESSRSNERTFSASAAQIQAALNKLQPTFSGRLPTLDGFVAAGRKSLEQYLRPFYQCTVHVAPSSGGSLVRVTAKITAWHENPPRSGYEVLQSNGRLESDLLDRLQESLAPTSAKVTESQPAPQISAPMPQFPQHTTTSPAPSADSPLRDEARSLEELLRNQSRPTSLVGVKQEQTPVLESARADGKILFLASAEDEFEVLDKNPEWIHVRISGLSRGWLRRSAVEMLDGSQSPRSEASAQYSGGSLPANPLFSISSEEVGVFPGTWDALKGKSTRIISVQQAQDSGRITSPQDKLQFAASVFKKEALAPGVDGLVLIFDSEDGGMVASRREVLDQWKRGTISEADFWKQCYLDPPEILGATN
jgi:hypothetical protein